MSRQNRRDLIVVFIALLFVFEMIAYVATTPRPREQFFQIYVLGANDMAADYYPNNDPNIRLGDSVQWYLGVTDFMGTVQFVAIRVKLGNRIIAPPDDQQALPSPAPLVAEFKRFIQNNETWEIPFVWSISNAVAADGSTRILELQINNETYSVEDSSALNGYNFPLIFELWTWETDLGDLQFVWQTAGEHRVAWLQVWFNMTTPRLQ